MAMSAKETEASMEEETGSETLQEKVEMSEETHPPSSCLHKRIQIQWKSFATSINWWQLLFCVLITVMGLVLYHVIANEATKEAKMSSHQHCNAAVMEEIEQLKRNITVVLAELRDEQEINLTEAINKILSYLEGLITELDTSKATKVTVEELTKNLTELDSIKVDKTTFETLMDNITSLRETISATNEEICELSVLAHNGLNQTDYNHLQEGIQDLNTRVSELENNTVETVDFLQAIDGINNTTTALHGDIDQLIHGLTSLAHNTTAALSNKADQNDVDTLSDKLTTLSHTTVNTTEFEIAIGSLSSSKADQSELESLELRVGQLEDTTAKESELNNLKHRVTSHISDSETTHNQLSSRITSNDGDISNNEQRIGAAERDIDQLQEDIEDSSPGLKPVWWAMAIVSAVVCFVG